MDDLSINATVLIAVPLAGAVLLALLPISRALAAYLATLVALAVAGAVAGLVYRFDIGGGEQFVTDEAWVESLGIRFHVGIDGLSLAMVAVTALVMACVIGYAAWEGGARTRPYYALLLLLESALLLLFTAQDLIMFYVGFEAMLIPLYFLIGIWGGARRTQATLKFLVYTFVGTLLMLVGMIALALEQEGGITFDIDALAGSTSEWIFLTFLLAFAIKSPIWPFHGWLPDAYRQAPPEVAAVLSGLASKAGAYGLLRLVLPIFPEPVAEYRDILLVLAMVGLLYGSLLAFRQPDSRGVIAYSSIGQMGLITLGIFVLNDRGASGAAFQMVNHAILSAALFLLAGWIATQTGSDLFVRLGGLARGRPILASVVLVIGVATLAVPGSSTFASEFLILLGAFEYEVWAGVLASAAIVLAAMYMLRWISAVLHDRVGAAVEETAPPDLAPAGGLLTIVPLVLAILALSFYPFGVTDRIDADTTRLSEPAAQEAAAP
jgi:NADH-quinone oxidoreductase subunit M